MTEIETKVHHYRKMLWTFIIDWQFATDAHVNVGTSVYLMLTWLSAFGKRQQEAAEVC